MKNFNCGLIFLLVIGFISCKSDRSKKTVSFERPVNSPEELLEHNKAFEQQVLEVAEGIHIAIGYGLANSILIEGENGNIIIDGMESVEAATKVKALFNEISDKPIKAIIYTHNHADHIMGAGIMAGDDQPEVYAHDLTNFYIDRLLNEVRPIMTTRSFRMFGSYLEDGVVNCGIGPYLLSDFDVEISIIRPTQTFEEELELNIEGVKMQLVHAPGETNDQIYIYLPERNILFCADNYYDTFPNLYTIRGTPYRDVKLWVQSLDKMRKIKPDILIPSHTMPLIGADTIHQVLTNYRDAIQFVHDQTVRYMNLGYTPDQIAERVILPPHLAQAPYLKEFYGRVDWSVKSIFDGYLGFFDGNPSSLLPLKEQDKAQKMAALAGGEAALEEKARAALAENAHQWALELTDYLLVLNPENKNASDIRAKSLLALGEAQTNPNARHYYLTMAKEAEGFSLPEIGLNERNAQMVTLDAIFKAMPTKLNPQRCADVDQVALFYFPDVDKSYTVHVRRGVAEVTEASIPDPDLTITMDTKTYKSLVAKTKKGWQAVLGGDIKVEPKIGAMTTFLDYFKE